VRQGRRDAALDELALDAQPPAALDVARRAHVRQRDAAVVQRAIGGEARDAVVRVGVGHALVEETLAELGRRVVAPHEQPQGHRPGGAGRRGWRVARGSAPRPHRYDP
jgi:hypothetical protein